MCDMARPLRIEFAGAVYHVISRGNAGNDVFFRDRDRMDFLSVLADAVKRYNWLCHAYCLMSNHYHLVIETPDGNLSQGMRHLNGVYTQKCNWKNERKGHIFQGRYKSILVEKDNYLMQVCRYIALNPVRAGLVKSPGEFRWSSYNHTAGLLAAPDFLTVDWVRGFFSTNQAKARECYREFVREGIDDESIGDIRGRAMLGQAEFIEKCQEFMGEKKECKEVPRKQRIPNRPQLSALLNGSNKAERAAQIYIAHVQYGYRLKEIADHLGVHYTTVSKVINGVRS